MTKIGTAENTERAEMKNGNRNMEMSLFSPFYCWFRNPPRGWSGLNLQFNSCVWHSLMRVLHWMFPHLNLQLSNTGNKHYANQ